MVSNTSFNVLGFSNFLTSLSVVVLFVLLLTEIWRVLLVLLLFLIEFWRVMFVLLLFLTEFWTVLINFPGFGESIGGPRSN